MRSRALAVWSGAEVHNVDAGTTLIPDPRVKHFWDSRLMVGKAYAPVIGSSEPAWDTWMLVGPDAMWSAASDEPPERSPRYQSGC